VPSDYLLFRFHLRLGEQEKAVESLSACFAILDEFARKGRPLDAQMRSLYEQLKPRFSEEERGAPSSER
jgi:hypothetical protein